MSTQLKQIKIDNGNIKSMSLFDKYVVLAMFVSTNWLVSLLNFKDIDASFNFKKYLVPPSNRYDYQLCVRHYDRIDKLLENRLRNGLNNNEIISNRAKETKSELEDCITTSEVFDMTWAVLSSLVSRLGSNTLEYDPNDLIKTIKSKNIGLYEYSCVKYKSAEHTLLHLREDFGPPKLLIRRLEESHDIGNCKHSIQSIFIDLRENVYAFGDIKNNVFHCQGQKNYL